MKRFFSDVPADGKWIRPGTDQATVGREIVGNAMREYLARNPDPSTTDAQAQRQAARDEFLARRYGQATIDSAYESYMQRKVDASKDDAQRLSEAAESSYRRNLAPTTDAEAQAERDRVRQEFMDKRHGKIEAAYQRKMRRLEEGKQ